MSSWRYTIWAIMVQIYVFFSGLSETDLLSCEPMENNYFNHNVSGDILV